MKFKFLKVIIVPIIFIFIGGTNVLASIDADFEFDSSSGNIVKYLGNDSIVEIPEKINGTIVTGIKGRAFYGKNSIEKIMIPNNVTFIGSSAFYQCSKLKSITIPNSVSTISSGAFSMCSRLESIVLPSNIEYIGNETFAYCSSLKSVTMQDGLRIIETKAFYKCLNLESIDIPNSVITIKDGVFADCENLKNVRLSNKLTSIDHSLFQGCESLESIIVPNGVTIIRDNAFRNCFKLKSVTIPSSVTRIGDASFYSCKSLEVIAIPNSVRSIGSNAFANTPYKTNSEPIPTPTPTPIPTPTPEINTISINNDLYNDYYWSYRYTEPENGYFRFRSMEYGNGIYLVVGLKGLILRSIDGANWERININESYQFIDIKFVNNKFYALGTNISMISEDGVNWEKNPVNITGVDFVNFKNKFIYLSGNPSIVDIFSNVKYIFVLDENNKIHMVDKENAPVYGGQRKGVYEGTYKSIVANDNIALISVDNNKKGKIIYSYDAFNWKECELPKSYSKIDQMTWAKDYFIAIVRDTNIKTLIKSKDGVKWSILIEDFSEEECFLTYDNVNEVIYVLEGTNSLINIDKFGNISRGPFRLYPSKKVLGSNIYCVGGNLYVGEMALKMNKSQITKVDFNISIKGKPLVLDSKPLVENGRTLVPVRAISEALGATVGWDEVNKYVTITNNDGFNMKLVIDGATVSINGKWKFVDIPPMISEGRTMLPLRFFSEALGLKVDWNSQNNSISIY